MDKWEQAAADLTQVLNIDPENLTAFLRRALIRRFQGDFDAALKDYDAAVKLAPKRSEIYFERGSARRQAGDMAGAIADYERSANLSRSPRDRLRVQRHIFHLRLRIRRDAK
jgi:tetratricopeptide (TPR) repeat protein